jgi:hypothetical protein
MGRVRYHKCPLTPRLFATGRTDARQHERGWVTMFPRGGTGMAFFT